jgi:polysaccharide export outer membrane protein
MRALLLSSGLAAALLLQGCAAAPSPFSPTPLPTPTFEPIAYSAWDETETDYRLFPGDEVDIAVPSAPELNRSVRVAPDGRITLPLVQPIMVADRTLPDLESALEQSYSGQLRRPDVEVSLKTTTPVRVFVGGEVDKPGVYDMPGDIDAVQAIMMAGGFRTGARRQEVVILRRGVDGRPMMRTTNLLGAVVRPGLPGNDPVPLRRYDVVYVPRSTIAEVGLFVQQYFRDALPIGFNYTIGDRNYN